MPGREGGQPPTAPVHRLAKRHFVNRAGAQPMLVQPRRGRSAKRQLMRCHVVRMSVRDKSARLTPGFAKIDRKIDARQLQAVGVMKHERESSSLPPAGVHPRHPLRRYELPCRSNARRFHFFVEKA